MTSGPTAAIFRGTPHNVQRLANALRRGQLVGVPTETVYGLAANAWDATACAKIFEVKGRPATDPLIVHIGALAELDALAEPNEAARLLARAFWPGPLTMVLPKRAAVPDIVTAHLPSVAVRMPAHPLFRRLLKATGRPLAAPSANPFGYLSPTTAEHVRQSLGKRIRYILDGGPAKVGLESTIIDLRDPTRPRLLRPGAISAAALGKVLKRNIRAASGARAVKPAAAQIAPGRLPRHYSPHTPVVLHARFTVDDARRERSQAWVFLRAPAGASGTDKNVFALSRAGDLGEVAQRLFATLRTVDQLSFQKIHVERAAGDGLAQAINDRLQRAATPAER